MIVPCYDCTESSPCWRDEAEPCWVRRHCREEMRAVADGLDRTRRRIVNLTVGARKPMREAAERAEALITEAANLLRRGAA